MPGFARQAFGACLTELLARYFREILLPLHTHSVGTSLSILASLIDSLPEE